MYAVIRVRGNISVSPKTKKTLELLNLKAVNNMSIWPENKQALKMIKSVENYVTFGKISEELLKEIIEKKLKKKKLEKDSEKIIKEIIGGKKLKEFEIENKFNLNPPKKGYGRKGIKKPFGLGGALGDRKEKINDLIKRMI